MTEFDTFSINSKMAVCEKKLKELTTVKDKISKNSKELEVQSLERANRVALFEVKIKHTSEYLVKMGSDYYAKVKTENALDIVSGRIKKVEEDLRKWKQLKEQLEKKKNNEKSGLNFELGAGRNGLECSIDSVGQNEEGEQIFNIVEFGEPQGLKREVNVFRDNINDAKEEEKVEEKEKEEMHISEEISHKAQQEKRIEPPVEKPEKKMSKFKMERMKMKEQK